MQTPLLGNLHGGLPNTKLSYTPMTSENTHYCTVRIQDSTRLIIEDSIVLVIEPQISLNLRFVPVGLAIYFGEGWMPKQSTSKNPGTKQISSATPDATRSSNGAHPARFYHDVTKLLVGHTRSISGPILRRRAFRLTAYSILYEKICCLC